MCGIVGAVAKRNVVSILVNGLLRLEYRGYDSAGLVVVHDGKLDRVRSTGRVAELATKSANTYGELGIAHTRWATHGVPSERNAHPHFSRNLIGVVHNGIIENYEELRSRTDSARLRIHFRYRHRSHRPSDPQPLRARQPAGRHANGAWRNWWAPMPSA